MVHAENPWCLFIGSDTSSPVNHARLETKRRSQTIAVITKDNLIVIFSAWLKVVTKRSVL